MSNATELTPLTTEQEAQFRWMDAPALQKVTGALEKVEGGCARYVGGCVRDSLLGSEPKDIDIATTLTPDVTMSALKAAGLRVAPTGLDHGTVTAIVDHQGIEITTLRADVSTDGRRATVAFTRDWAEDAQRRDFTINAIYLTPDRKLYDPVGGIADASKKRVRFIGDPEQRIREDYLRILRFFRFSARFCDCFDADGLAACAALKKGIETLSAERIGAELTAILTLPKAAFALEAMSASGVLNAIWPNPADLITGKRLKDIAADAAAPLMLAALWGDEGQGIGARLRLSNAEKAVRSNALKASRVLQPPIDETSLRLHLYRMGKDVLTDGVLLAAAKGRLDESALNTTLEMIESMEPPVFVISGKHIVEAGIEPGPAVSRLLSDIEERWIASGFPEEARQHELLSEALKIFNAAN